MPIGGSATCSSTAWWAIVTTPPTGTIVKIKKRRDEREVRRELEDEAVGPLGHQVLFEEELRPVGERLQQPEGSGAVRADAVLHVGDDLALEPDHQHHRDEQDAEGDEHLHDDDEEHGEADAVGEERIAHQTVSSADVGRERGGVDERPTALGSPIGVALNWTSATPVGTAASATAATTSSPRGDRTRTIAAGRRRASPAPGRAGGAAGASRGAPANRRTATSVPSS